MFNFFFEVQNFTNKFISSGFLKIKLWSARKFWRIALESHRQIIQEVRRKGDACTHKLYIKMWRHKLNHLSSEIKSSTTKKNKKNTHSSWGWNGIFMIWYNPFLSVHDPINYVRNIETIPTLNLIVNMMVKSVLSTTWLTSDDNLPTIVLMLPLWLLTPLFVNDKRFTASRERKKEKTTKKN